MLFKLPCSPSAFPVFFDEYSPPVRWVNELIHPLFGIQSAFVGGQSGWGVAQAGVGGVAAVIVRSASISAWLAPSKLNPGTL